MSLSYDVNLTLAKHEALKQGKCYWGFHTFVKHSNQPTIFQLSIYHRLKYRKDFYNPSALLAFWYIKLYQRTSQFSLRLAT